MPQGGLVHHCHFLAAMMWQTGLGLHEDEEMMIDLERWREINVRTIVGPGAAVLGREIQAVMHGVHLLAVDHHRVAFHFADAEKAFQLAVEPQLEFLVIAVICRGVFRRQTTLGKLLR